MELHGSCIRSRPTVSSPLRPLDAEPICLEQPLSNVGFLFPGQGAQSIGMGKATAESLPTAGKLLDRANEILEYDLKRICFEGPEDQLHATENSQPALFVASMIALERLKQENLAAVDGCTIAAGLSLGEYSALCFAGVLTFEDALRVVRRRGQAMQRAADAQPSGMVAILGFERSQVDDLVAESRGEGVLAIANLLCPKNIVCSGDNAACERLKSAAESAGAMKVIPLTVAGAFHTSLMQPAVQELADVLSTVEMQVPRIPVVSNVDAQPHTNPEEIRELLTQQVVSPVYWEDSVRHIISTGVEELFEVGTGKVLRGLMKRIDRKFPFQNIE